MEQDPAGRSGTDRRRQAIECEGMRRTLVVSFPGTVQTSVAEVGGKGHWLIRLAEAGLPVPPGAVLTTCFFAPWFDGIKRSAAWKALSDAPSERWATLCGELKNLCPALSLTHHQRQALEYLRETLATPAHDGLFAVRSSSPEEDLASASFAGGYATRLGVRSVDLDEAVRHCFASSLDERVLVYKRERGFDVLSPRIAVVVQQQIDSEIAGVGFSLNPLTNDYDEAVIDANWGLGESVVAGLVSPDHFIVDKVSRRIVGKKWGAKAVSIWLAPDGGTIRRKDHCSAEFTLSDTQLGELTSLMCRIESLYGKPTDIEWAYAGGQLHLLQARPITTYVPLPPEMLTKPGERRLLYADAALSKGMTTNAPFSPMELAWEQDFYSFVEDLAGIGQTPDKGLIFFAGGRMYMNLSNMMWLASPERLSTGTAATDVLMAETLANIDKKQYRSATKPPWARLRSLRLVPKFLWLLRGTLWRFAWAMLSPERAHRTYRHKAAAYGSGFTENLDESLSLTEFRETYSPVMTRQLFGVTMPVLGAGMAAVGLVDLVVGGKSDEARDLAEKLKFGFTGDVVIEMGIALFRLARLVEPSDFGDLTRLVQRIEHRQMSAGFLNAWDAFLSTYGWRGCLEMDLASPRYADDPVLALRQMSFMTLDDAGFDPEAAHQRHVAERRQAYEELMNRLSWLRRMLLRRVHRVIDLLAGTRDDAKHQIVLFKYALRKRTLIEGRRLAREGRLDTAGDVFNLTFPDLESANSNPSLDLRKVIEERTRFLKILKAQVSEFPQVIDSRGRILRPAPREERTGELTGMAVSPGVVTGPVKMLRNPHEKPVNKGDVLVAYTTDPGWTPLFVNAAAVVLEVGGVLQHGAVVAREYGKPCVAGIDRLMTKLRDGQRVEVDGTAGVVRVLS
jgi:rifampicin phosphotransferase